MDPREAGARILALVCGYAGNHALKRGIMVLNAYCDPSGKGDPNLLVMAGYIATAETWIEFSKEWQARLDQTGLPFFKMKRMARQPEIAGWFYRVLEEHDIKAAIACILHTDELVRVNRRIKYPPHIVRTHEIEKPLLLCHQGDHRLPDPPARQ